MNGAIAIIPARGGSKRLPRKNILPLAGKPVIAHTIEGALASGEFERVLVSTEDNEIADIAIGAGAEHWPRSPALASDNATVVDVCIEILCALKEVAEGSDRFCCLLAPSALRKPEDIVGVRRLLQPDICDFAMAVTEYSKPPTQALVVERDGSAKLQWPELDLPRSQLPRLMVDAGSVYWCRTDAFLAEMTFYGSTLKVFSIPRERGIDVDTEEDWALLEFLMSHRDG